jgi:hypothetical protein
MREHRKLEQVSATKWDKESLFKLYDLMVENMNTKYNSDAITVCSGETSVSGESLQDVLDDFPYDKIDSVNFKVLNWNTDDKIDKGIHVSLRPTVADYQIHSTDEAWFKGKSAQLDELFQDQKPWYGFIHSIFPNAIGAIQGILIGLGFYLFFESFFSTLIVLCISSLGLHVAFKQYLEGKLFPNTAFKLESGNKISFEAWTLFFTAVAAISTVVSLCLQILGSDS